MNKTRKEYKSESTPKNMRYNQDTILNSVRITGNTIAGIGATYGLYEIISNDNYQKAALSFGTSIVALSTSYVLTKLREKQLEHKIDIYEQGQQYDSGRINILEGVIKDLKKNVDMKDAQIEMYELTTGNRIPPIAEKPKIIQFIKQ